MINILNINVRGLKKSKNNYEKINEITNILEINKINLAILTESHNHEPNIFNNRYSVIQSAHPKLGITILYDRSIQMLKWKEIVKGRRIDMKISINNEKINISGVYCSADADLCSMKQIINRNKADILIGDFNIVLNKQDKSTPFDKRTCGTREALQNFITKNCMLDLSSHFNNQQHTFFKKSYSSKIDRVYANYNIVHRFKEYKIITTSSNFDHSGVFTCIDHEKEKESFRYWKLNNAMLNNRTFLNKIMRVTKEIPSNINSPEEWLVYKNKIKSKIKKIQKFYHHQKNKKLKKLQDYQSKIYSNDPTNYDKIHYLKERIKSINNHVSKIRREKILTNLDKSKPFSISKNIINFVYAQNPKQILENKITIEAQEEYYSRIFNQNNNMDEKEINEMLKCWESKLTDEEREDLNSPITINEIKQVLYSRKSNSAPGPDGLTYLFYKKTKDIILRPMCKLFNILLQGEELTSEMKTSYTIPIYKRKGNVNEPENWRPIALSNSDYKIYTSILNRRLSRYNSKLISKNQTGFGRNKFIIDNVLIITEILRMKYKKYAILCLDIAKAFDSINHDAIYKILTHINSGNFVKCIKAIYSNTQTKIIHNGKISKPIQISNGVKQGDVISPLLFNLGIDLMTKCLIKQIKGIEVHGIKINLLQYADDTTIICGSELDINTTVRILKQTKSTLNLETNYSKSAAFTKLIEIPRYIKHGTEERILGYYFNKDRIINNIDSIIDDIIHRCKNWRKFGGNLAEKSTIWKVFIIPKLWYWIWVLQPTFKQVSTLYNVQNWFIYHREMEYDKTIKYKKTMNEGRSNKHTSEGGLGLYYINDRIKAYKINIIDRALKGKDLLHMIVINILKKGVDKNNSLIGRFLEYHVAFCQKNPDLLIKDLIPIKKIYHRLIEAKQENVKLTENQVEMEDRFRVKFDQIWEIIEELKILNKHKYFLWRYFNNLLQIPRQSSCKLCGLELTKQHIIFDCKIVKNNIDQANIDKYTISAKRWNEKNVLGLMFQQIDRCSSKINWQKYRTQIGIIYKIWVNFTAIQYGRKSNQAITTNYKQDLIDYVKESNCIYHNKKKKKKKKIIIETKDINKEDVPLFKNEDYAILLKKNELGKRNLKHETKN